MQNRNKMAGRERAKAMFQANKAKGMGTGTAAAANKQAMRDKIKVQNNPTQGKPMPSNPPGMRQQAVGQAKPAPQAAQREHKHQLEQEVVEYSQHQNHQVY